MRTRKSRVTRRDFLGRVAAVVGGVSVGLTGLQASATSAAAASVEAVATGTAPRVAAVVHQAGTSVVASMAERLLTMDPANHISIAATTVQRHIYDPLVDVTGNSQIVPALAESWEILDDLTWRFRLRQGVTFHDGTPLTSADVVYSLARPATDTKLQKNSVLGEISSVEPEGASGVIVRTRTPFGSLLGHLTMLGIMPASAAGREDAFFQAPVGTGPFKLTSWTLGEEVQLAANTNYWASGSPKVSSATFRFIPEVSTRAAGLRTGEIDIIDRIPADMVSTLQGSPGVQVLTRPSVETQQWVFQLQNPPLDNVMVRKAVSMAIDRDTIVNEFHLGYAQTAVSPIPPGLVGHVNLGTKLYDPSGARELLRQSGASNLALDFILMKGVYTKQLEIAEAVQAMLGEIGITLTIKELERAAAIELRAAGNYHMFYSGWAHMPHDPDWYFGSWFTAKGAAILTRYNNPVVEQLIVDARSTNNTVRQQKYEQIQRIVWDEEEATIWPYYSTAVYGARDRVSGYEARPDYYVLLNNVMVG